MERAVAVPPEEVIQTETQLLEDHAHVVPVVKPLQEADAVQPALRVILLQGVEHLQLHAIIVHQ